MKIKEVIDFLENHAPPKYQESYDNSGLLLGQAQWELTGILVCLDAIESVIDEAIETGANMVIAHHPIIFSGLKTITGANYIEKVVIKAIKNNIAVYAIHTNLDNVATQGVNSMICDKLGLLNCQILAPKADTDPINPNIGAGMIGDFSVGMSEMKFLEFLKDKMQTNTIKYTELLGKEVLRVAVCGGSGRFLLQNAISQNADVFVSSDFKYHEFFDADGRILIADIGHYESEQFTIELLVDLLSKNFSKFAPHCTKIVTNPVNYF